MPKTTPFYPRLSELNTTGLYGHWSGYLSALRYDHVGQARVLRGPQRRRILRHARRCTSTGSAARTPRSSSAGVMTRDIRLCKPGRAQYTIWCDDRGFVLEDGVVFRHSDNEYFMTTAEPNLGYFSDLVGRLDVTIEDVTEDYAMLAVQGPRSREILAQGRPGGRPTSASSTSPT